MGANDTNYGFAAQGIVEDLLPDLAGLFIGKPSIDNPPAVLILQ